MLTCLRVMSPSAARQADRQTGRQTDRQTDKQNMLPAIVPAHFMHTNISSRSEGFKYERVERTVRPLGFVEFGNSTAITRRRFFNTGIGLGVTPAAPGFFMTASLPFLF